MLSENLSKARSDVETLTFKLLLLKSQTATLVEYTEKLTNHIREVLWNLQNNLETLDKIREELKDEPAERKD